MSDGCPFCQVSEDRVAFVGKFLLALWDGYPVTEGHLLLVPKRHVATWSDLDEDERTDLVEGINAAQEFLRSRYSLDGFNIGFNEGEAAGQTVPHFHIDQYPLRHDCPRESKGLGPCWYVEILLPTYRRGLGLLGVTLHQPGR